MRSDSGTSPCNFDTLANHGVNKPCLAGSAQGTGAKGAEADADGVADNAADGEMGGEEGWLMDNPILQSLLRLPCAEDRLTFL
jgi:hypothetical protein